MITLPKKIAELDRGNLHVPGRAAQQMQFLLLSILAMPMHGKRNKIKKSQIGVYCDVWNMATPPVWS